MGNIVVPLTHTDCMFVFIYILFSSFCSIKPELLRLEVISSFSLNSFKLERQQLLPSAGRITRELANNLVTCNDWADT